MIQHDKPLRSAEFESVVDLAYKMPAFGPEEKAHREIAPYRLLRGLGAHWRESGLLDLMIALEAALLPGIKDELRYRFALYGAAYLRGERDPEQIFRRLRNLYDARSKLVHGEHVKTDKRDEATKEAADLAKAVISQAVEKGWPDPKELDREILGRHVGLR